MPTSNDLTPLQPILSPQPPDNHHTPSRRLFWWFIHHFGNPLLSLVCVYMGVLNTVILPPTFLAILNHVATSNIQLTLLAALPIAIIVWRKRAYAEWCAMAHAPLGERMLTAVSIGVIWGLHR